MSLDFHLAQTKEEAEKKYPELSMAEEVHDRLFYDKGKPRPMPKQLKKMADYYADASFEGGEIPELLSSLTQIQSTRAFEQQQETFHQLIALCEKAIREGGNIYVFCD